MFRKTVFIGSTALDLPDYRAELKDDILSLGMFPKMMEHLKAQSPDGLAVSLGMVDEAHIYIGVIAHRYGYIPPGDEHSITHSEYLHAVERAIPILLFLAPDDGPPDLLAARDEPNQAKLKAFKAHLRSEHVVKEFRTPLELGKFVVLALVDHYSAQPGELHAVRRVPLAPEPYVAHPYALLQTPHLIGRKAELSQLDDWLVGRDPKTARIGLSHIVAIGGMGKSALTWAWFQAKSTMKELAGALWWSFYESDARFDNFVRRALAYAIGETLDALESWTPAEREERLLDEFARRKFLIVLDGFERIQTAYTRFDAPRLTDTELDRQTGHFNPVANWEPASGETPGFISGLVTRVGKKLAETALRKTADPRAGAFLKKLAQRLHAGGATRVLVSTRLYPAELETASGRPIPGTGRENLLGLEDGDAGRLWNALGARGDADVVLRVLQTFGKHPLLIQSLAGEVAAFPPAPGDYNSWRTAHPDFNPFAMPLAQVQTHVLKFALAGLTPDEARVLRTIAGFRMPTGYDTLQALFVGSGRAFAQHWDLLQTLRALDQRGLLGWDKPANRYDLHPVVRGVAWSLLNDDEKIEVFDSLHRHFAAIPASDDEPKRIEDLAVAIELYNTLAGLGRFPEAFELFRMRLFQNIVYRVNAPREMVELLRLLFEGDGAGEKLRIEPDDQRVLIFNYLGLGYDLSGEITRSIGYYRQALKLLAMGTDRGTHRACLCNLSAGLIHIGRLREAESTAREALRIAKEMSDITGEAIATVQLGTAQSQSGSFADALLSFEAAAALHLPKDAGADRIKNLQRFQGVVESRRGETHLGCERFDEAKRAAEAGLAAATVGATPRDQARAQLVLAEIEFCRGGSARALADDALASARRVNFIELECAALLLLAEWEFQVGGDSDAREFLEEAVDLAALGPFRAYQADAERLQSMIESRAGDPVAAEAHWRRGLELARGDDPEFSYRRRVELLQKWGLQCGFPSDATAEPSGESAPILPPDSAEY